MAQQFQAMATFEIQSANEEKHGQDLEQNAFRLEEDEETGKSAKDLQHQASFAKLSALKFMHLQVALASSDIEKAYWTNRALALAVPPEQMATKLYKQYLSTLALSVAIQVHDAFTTEAHLDDFNDRFGVGGATQIAEAVAEQLVYSRWTTLVQLRLALFYLSMSEQQQAVQGYAGQEQQPYASDNNYNYSKSNNNNNAFLEVEAAADPSIGPDTIVGQYASLNYYRLLLKMYTIYTELSLTQAGTFAANLKIHAAIKLNDEDSSNDEEAVKTLEQGQHLSNTIVPYQFLQWSQLVQARVFVDSSLLAIDMHLPQAAPLRQMQREGNAVEDLAFAQTTKA